MEIRIVALTVLENLLHSPLPRRTSHPALVHGVSEDDDINNNGDGGGVGGLLSSSDADDDAGEPRQRKLDRYRAVLLLPHLCHKLRGRWVEVEIVPYLLRCVEEEDAQLALVAGVALLGVVLPRRALLGPPTAGTPTTTTTATPAAAEDDAAAKNTGSNPGAFLSVDDVLPVCALLAASSIEETRAFTAQVILPHIFFGVALERDVTLERWDVKYVPHAVLQADMDATTAASEAAGGGGGAAVSNTRLMAAVRKQLHRQHQQLVRRTRDAAATSSGAPPVTSNTAAAAAPAVHRAPTEEDVRQRCHRLAMEDEAAQFSFSGGYATLAGPWCFDGCAALASLARGAHVGDGDGAHGSSGSGGSGSGGGVGVDRCGGSSSSSGGGVSTGAASPFHCFRRHCRRTDHGAPLHGAPPPALLPLTNADMDIYGAAYAVDTDGSGDDGAHDDFFSLNVRALAVVSTLVGWMEALSPPPPPSTPATVQPAGGGAGGGGDVSANGKAGNAANTARLCVDGSLSLLDYLCCDGRRELLRCRWRALLKLLQDLLESPHPGPVAVATETVSGLLHAIQTALWEAEQHQKARASSSSSSSTRRSSLAAKLSPSDAAAEAAEAWPGISKPASPLLTTAELQAFTHRVTRSHVAYCVAAAVSARTVPMPAAPTAASMKVLLDSVGRLMRSALVTAHGVLIDLLLRHHVLVSRDACSGGGGGGATTLQAGAGPSESRVAPLSLWDVCFAVGAGGGGANLPDDVTFLLATTPSGGGGGGGVVGGAPWLPGAVNTVSAFRLHRLVRRALLRALPLCVDFVGLFHSSAATAAAAARALPSTGTGSASTPAITVAAVCPLLLQVLVPPTALGPLLDALPTALEAQQQQQPPRVEGPGGRAGVSAARTPSTRHVDPVAPLVAEECPASVDFGVLEAALDAVQRLTAEAAVQLTGALWAPPLLGATTTTPPPPSHMVEAACAQLHTLLSACLQWVPRFTNWKARWLIAQRLPQLTATFCFFLARVAELADVASGAASSPPPPPPCEHRQRALTWLTHTLHLLTSLWACAAQFGAAPLNDLMDDEEEEVRCVATCCAARCFGVATEAALRLSGSSRLAEGAATPSASSLLLTSLTEPLARLLDATAQCVLVAASDSDSRVRCHSAEALASLSRSLSLLVAATGRDAGESTPWARYLRSNTDALLRLLMDDKPVVQLALVSQLTDVLLLRMQQPSARPPPEGVADVQYDALLQCLRRLAQHELWRLREQYAVLLAHLCGRLLLTHAATPHAQQQQQRRLNAPTDTGAAARDAAVSWAHTHPLYQLARTELLELLVAVLFDKVRAVRDAALDAVERLCMQIAAAAAAAAAAAGASDASGNRSGGADGADDDDDDGGGGGGGGDHSRLNRNTFVDDVLWPQIHAYAPAWETYLSRSALLRIAMRLRVDKVATFLPLLDQLARDPVLNVRLVVAKVVLEVLLRSAPEAHGVAALSLPGSGASGSATAHTPELPSGTIALSLLMNKPLPLLHGDSGRGTAVPPLQFDESERTGVVLQILRQLLKDVSADVRDEAAKALKVCL
ncbi:hypothetical protein NESM_000381900 [Novymonas esmeraldas]|uniref:HEAT repeat-containing protein 1 n=1 Tax=Novymonas esmeraldas TaxID=1808958 RepID=A0AAW0EMF9_9TRYP